MEKRSSIYFMHKYWGKKPLDELSKIISAYSNVGDTILDPFAGFGGFAVEGLLLNRNVIINDLNPAATFIAGNVLEKDISIEKFTELLLSLKSQYSEFEKKWYRFKGYEIITIQRNSSDVPLKLRLRSNNKYSTVVLTEEEQKMFMDEENGYVIETWFPRDLLIENPRICVKNGMCDVDLFPRRALICHSFLLDLIEKTEECPEKNLLRFTFTSNLANCSKLVPPISSRGDMSQGAWMTGFYVGETYLENNVFHYFESRAAKTLKGKKNFLRLLKENDVKSTYKILNEDSKRLSVQNSSVDFVFTDFPYGDTVPYFEQSQLWNHWLKNDVNYEDEIVISDSPQRAKDFTAFKIDIEKAVSEISRILKDKKYFVFTFHSLSGKEWDSIIAALKKYKFFYRSCEILKQKTLPPRQLNRANSIKGDILVVYQKDESMNGREFDVFEALQRKISAFPSETLFDTNDLITMIVRSMLETNFSFDKNFKEIFDKYFVYNEELKKWRKVK